MQTKPLNMHCRVMGFSGFDQFSPQTYTKVQCLIKIPQCHEQRRIYLVLLFIGLQWNNPPYIFGNVNYHF